VKLTVDHVVPVALGGADEPANLVTACHDCNAGKSATAPDQATVADVAQDALRWRAAMLRAQEQTIADREGRERFYGAFLELWNAWTYLGDDGERHRVDLPSGWRSSLDLFRGAELLIDEVKEAIEAAMTRPVQDEFVYTMGILHNKVKQRVATARAFLDEQPETAG
jgi:hypothetical protein